jgi:tagaturonate reductase
MTKRIIQFGTSRFLQAHADLFIHEARMSGQDIGPITVVKSTSGTERAGRVSALATKGGYPVIIRGITNGKTINETLTIKSIDDALTADGDWRKLTKLFANDAELVISNVGESGYAIAGKDEFGAPAASEVPASFPAKLLSLLHARYLAGAKPLLILPCELVSENGKVLRALLEGLSVKWKLGAGFDTWLAKHVTICDTLVDRIVSEAIEPVGAIAEPYALWAIKREASSAVPFSHPAVVITDDLEPFLRLKLHILNLGHTFLAEIWQSEKRPADETVRELLSDGIVKNRLIELYREEVIPGFAGRGMEDAARVYVVTTLERFENPFLNHRLNDISQHHRLKIERRVIDFMSWVRERKPSAQFPKLEALAKQA